MANTNKERLVANAAVMLAISADRESEGVLKATYSEQDIRTAAVDIGGEFLKSTRRMVEQAVVAARREGLIEENSPHSDGCIAGALHDVLGQVAPKASGLSVGGKIGMARWKDHVCVAIFLSIGLLYLDDVALGVAHRLI